VANAPASLECRLTQIVQLPGEANFAVFGEVTGVHLRDDCLKDGEFDVLSFNPLTRMGYRDYSVIREKFSLKRPGRIARFPSRRTRGILASHTRKESGMAETVIGVIGGSGVYGIEGLEDARWERVATPWGDPSDEILTGRLDGIRMAFLPRHGRGHVLTPSTVPYRANIDALKRLGVTDVISISACGSFREEMAPGHFVIVDQFIDRTFAREKSFFGPGLVAHVSVAHPTCPRLGDAVRRRRRPRGSRCTGAAPTSAWKARSSPRWPNPALPRGLGLRRDRHDQHARGQARPRGGALLRLRRHGDRLRQLAPRARRGRDLRHHPDDDGEFRRRGRRWWRGCPAPGGRSARPVRTAATGRSSSRS
jgi:hypothetical protein